MWIYGRNVLLEAVSSDFFIHKILIQKDINIPEKLDRIISTAQLKNITIDYVDRSELTKLIGNEEHQGIAAHIQFETKKLKDVINKNFGSFIYITESSFIHNIGAIARTAETAGFAGVIVSPKQTITAEMLKISAGAMLHIPIIKDSVFNTIKMLKKIGMPVYGIERGGIKYFDANLKSDCLFIIGGEDKSLSDPVRSKCDDILEIPQFGSVNSLNMSVAASIVFYEHIRQKISN